MDNLLELSTKKGFSSPFGVSFRDEGVNFALPSKQAKEVTLCLFDRNTHQLLKEIPLHPEENRSGDVWHIFFHSLPENLAYAYHVNGEDESVPSTLGSTPLGDPYATSLATRNSWGIPSNIADPSQNAYLPIADLIQAKEFEWNDDIPPHIPLNELIIYEMHVRGFTEDPSSQAKHPGTFLGIIEKIPHLLELGINAIELMPVQEFNELEYRWMHPHIKLPLFNYWGYSTVNFFAPMNRYASSSEPSAAINEFKMLVKELHKHKIEVILDVVFNHTAEGGEEGMVLSFKGLDNSIYYMLDEDHNYRNYTGCGNTFNANHPEVEEFIIACLRYWVEEMHVDGFRFDLASALTRGTDGQPMSRPSLIEAITSDPILASIKLIAEPWDAIGLYQVGSFAPETKRWSEWNGKYRDGVRRFIKGSEGANGEFAMRLCGSQDLYHSRGPTSSINFVTAHDGFSLRDLVSFNEKSNLQNGENNRDGSNDNESWNCGIEGDTTNKKVLALRERQMRNFHLSLMVSQGVPMLLMGDEYGHSKQGNNNTWCHDNALNWFSWDLLEKNESFYRFYRLLIDFRKSHPLLHRTDFLTNKDVNWHGTDPFKPDWSADCRVVAFTLKDPTNNNDLYIAFNAYHVTTTIHLPNPPHLKNWHWIVNTANNSPSDIYEKNQGPILKDYAYKMLPHSAIVLEALA